MTISASVEPGSNIPPTTSKTAVLALTTEADPTAFVTVDDMLRVDRGYGRLAK